MAKSLWLINRDGSKFHRIFGISFACLKLVRSCIFVAEDFFSLELELLIGILRLEYARDAVKMEIFSSIFDKTQ